MIFSFWFSVVVSLAAKHYTENDCTQEDSTYSAGCALFPYGQLETMSWLDAAKSDAQRKFLINWITREVKHYFRWTVTALDRYCRKI